MVIPVGHRWWLVWNIMPKKGKRISGLWIIMSHSVKSQQWVCRRTKQPNQTWQLKISIYRLVGGLEHFLFFHNIWDNPSHWLILFNMVKTTVTSPFVDDFPTTPRVIVPMEQEAPDRWFRWCGASDHVRGPRSGGTVARPFYDGCDFLDVRWLLATLKLLSHFYHQLQWFHTRYEYVPDKPPLALAKRMLARTTGDWEFSVVAEPGSASGVALGGLAFWCHGWGGRGRTWWWEDEVGSVRWEQPDQL